MSPRRWLLLACSVALIYATQMVSAFAMNDNLLPVQLNGAVLTVMGVGFILAAMYYLAERSERLAVARDNAHAELISQATDLLRRLGHLEARMSTKVESLADQTAKFDQLWTNLAAHMSRLDPAVLADHPHGYARGFAHGIAHDLPLDEVDIELRRLTEDER